MEEARNHSNTATAQRRQRQIEDCLYEFMHHTPYHAIRVADICRQVGISRKAFYNYFRDKDACLLALLEDIIRDSLLYVSQNLPENADALQGCIVILDNQRNNRDFLDILVQNNLVGYFLWASTQFYLKEEPHFPQLLNTPEVKSDEDILAALFSALIMLLLQWYYRGFDTPTEEMAKKFLRLLHSPLVKLPEELA